MVEKIEVGQPLARRIVETNDATDALARDTEVLSFESKSWFEVFQEAATSLFLLISSQTELLRQDDQISRLEKSQAKYEKELLKAQRDKNDFEEAQEAFLKQPGQVLVEKVLRDRFAVSGYNIADEMVEELPPDSSEEDKDHIKTLSFSVEEKIFNAEYEGKKSIQLEGEEGNFYQRVLSQARTCTDSDISLFQDQIESIKAEVEQITDQLKTSPQSLRAERESLQKMIKILDQKEKEEGAPSFEPEAEEAASQAIALIDWRRRKMYQELRERYLDRGEIIGNKWAFFWLNPKNNYILLNKETICDHVYPEDYLINRVPGTTYVVLGECLYSGSLLLAPRDLVKVENGIPELLTSQEKGKIEEKLLPFKEKLESQLD